MSRPFQSRFDKIGYPSHYLPYYYTKWFWHGLLTSSYSKIDLPALLWRQHELIARHALGSFRQMLIDFSVDPALLLYSVWTSQAEQDKWVEMWKYTADLKMAAALLLSKLP